MLTVGTALLPKNVTQPLFNWPLRMAPTVTRLKPVNTGTLTANWPSSPTLTVMGKAPVSAFCRVWIIKVVPFWDLTSITADYLASVGVGFTSTTLNQSVALLVPTRNHIFPFQHSHANCKSGEGRTLLDIRTRAGLGTSTTSSTVAPVAASPSARSFENASTLPR